LETLDNNKLYFAKKSINQFTFQELNKIPEGIIISKNYLQIQLLLGLYEFNRSHTNYLDLVLFQYLHLMEINYELLNVDYKLILFKCNIIAIAGNSGSGKSSLIKVLKLLFNNDNLVLETDRYHKWERGDFNYQIYTHLNPYANHLEKMYDDVYNLKIGNKIYQVDYDHSSGKFTPKQKIESKSNLMLCGLHTIYEKKMSNLINLKIFIDTDRELVKKWKVQRDVYERGYSIEKVLKSIETRNQDYLDHILPQKENADIIINYYEENEDLKCKLLITKDIGCRIYISLLEDYNMIFKDNYLVIQLNNIEITNENIIKIFSDNEQSFQKEYLKDIFYILYLAVSS
jgi:uridine kinase